MPMGAVMAPTSSLATDGVSTTSPLKQKLMQLRAAIHQTELSLSEMKKLAQELDIWQRQLQQTMDAVPVATVDKQDMAAPISLQEKQGAIPSSSAPKTGTSSAAASSFNAVQMVDNLSGQSQKSKTATTTTPSKPKAPMAIQQTVTALRLGKDYRKMRIVLDFMGHPQISHHVMVKPDQIILKLPATAWKATTGQHINSGIVHHYKAKIIDEASQTVEITFDLMPGARLDRTFTLTDRQPYRLVMDVVK